MPVHVVHEVIPMGNLYLATAALLGLTMLAALAQSPPGPDFATAAFSNDAGTSDAPARAAFASNTPSATAPWVDRGGFR